MPGSYGLDIPGFRKVTGHYEDVRAEVAGAVKGTEELLAQAPKAWDEDAVTRQFTGKYKENVQQLIDAAKTVFGFVDEFVTTAGGTSARNEMTEENNVAAAVHFGGKVGRTG
jgi:hypothetical protein